MHWCYNLCPQKDGLRLEILKQSLRLATVMDLTTRFGS